MIKFNGKDIIPRIDGKEVSRVMYNGKQIYPTESDIVEPANSNCGDICVADITNNNSLLIIKGNKWNAEKYPINVYVPIGIVVVPGIHNVYKDGTCGVMSLNHMNCSSPTIGGSAQNMYWGVYGTDIDTLENLDKVPYVGSNGSVGDTVIGVTGNAYLPSDHANFTAVTNPYDPGTKYYSRSVKYAPSPYNKDETFNTNYSMTGSPSSAANCLSDFDGKENTQKIIEVRGSKDYRSWLPTYNTQADYPAVSCCDMYFTLGTNQGDWYLPSAGELGYAVVRQQAINDKINELVSAGITSANSVQLTYYWSSSEYSSNAARSLSFGIGGVSYDYKSNLNYVRAFLRV